MTTSRTLKFIGITLFTIIFSVVFTACKKGCTEQGASNYDEKAKKDDGSCVFREKSTNSEIIGEGGELYFVLENNTKNYTGIEVYVNDAYIGLLQDGCFENLDCETTCEKVRQLELIQGTHSYHAISINSTINGNEEINRIVEGSVFIADGDCKVILINNEL